MKEVKKYNFSNDQEIPSNENKDEIIKNVKELLSSNEEGNISKFFRLWNQKIRNSHDLIDSVFYEIIDYSRGGDKKKVRDLIYMIGSDIEYVSPEMAQRVVVEFREDPSGREEMGQLENTLVNGAVYNIRHKEGYLEEILDQINFTDPKHFTTSARMLGFLWRVLSSSGRESYAETNVGLIIEALEKESKKPEANYFLKKYADIVLDLKSSSISFQALNLMIDPDYDEENRVEAKELFAIDSNLKEKEYSTVVNDFNFITSPFFSDILKKDTGVETESLSLAERYYTLQYIQKMEYQGVEQLKEFNIKYSNPGFKTFLSIEQGGKEMGDKILELGEKLPKESAEKVFNGYSALLDSAERIKGLITESMKSGDLDGSLKEKLPNELHGALILRAKDILLGAYSIAMEDITKLNIEDVLNAIEGVTTMLDILADMPEQKNYDFTLINKTANGLKLRVDDKTKGYEYELKTFVRPRKERNAQARINFELNFDTVVPNENLKKAFFNSTKSHKQNNLMEGSNLRIGIDREDHEEAGRAHVSLDMGRAYREDDELSRTGDVLGNFFEEAVNSHHTTETFSPEFGEEETFASIAEKFRLYLNELQEKQ